LGSRSIQKLAEAEGFSLIEIHHDHQPGYYGTFYQLIDELKRVQASHTQAPMCHVLVPLLEHLSAHPLLREQMLRRVEEANAQVWAVER
jgi:hypothetical protein